MKRINLNLANNHQLLTKDQMKKILGGDGNTCYYSGKRPDGSTFTGYSQMPDDMSCSQQSSTANSGCVTMITDGYASNCSYDCACDGVGS